VPIREVGRRRPIRGIFAGAQRCDVSLLTELVREFGALSDLSRKQEPAETDIRGTAANSRPKE